MPRLVRGGACADVFPNRAVVCGLPQMPSALGPPLIEAAVVIRVRIPARPLVTTSIALAAALAFPRFRA
jgi:hypothetical protein